MITLKKIFLAATLGGKQFWSGALPFCDKGTTPQSFLFEIIDVLYMVSLEFKFMFYTCFSLKSLFYTCFSWVCIYMFLFEIFMFYAYFSLKLFNIL